MIERRKARRFRTLKGARILMLDQWGRTVECIVRDLSNGGARLAPATVRVPDRFQIMFEASRLVRQCRVVWRRETEVGVAFLAHPGERHL
jgi:PilZ domain